MLLKTDIKDLSIKEFEGIILARAKEIDFSKNRKCVLLLQTNEKAFDNKDKESIEL